MKPIKYNVYEGVKILEVELYDRVHENIKEYRGALTRTLGPITFTPRFEKNTDKMPPVSDMIEAMSGAIYQRDFDTRVTHWTNISTVMMPTKESVCSEISNKKYMI